ncbi:hypothetical protein ACGFIV_18920 [Sphaerisporangium sp. NPDC049003]
MTDEYMARSAPQKMTGNDSRWFIDTWVLVLPLKPKGPFFSISRGTP